MAALVKLVPQFSRNGNVLCWGPVKVADAVDTDLSTPDTSIIFDAKGVKFVTVWMKFANYTSVTVKLQETLDNESYMDITGATTSTTNTDISAHREGPIDSTDRAGLLRGSRIRISIAGTLSASADTMEVWLYAEGAA